MVAFSLSTSRPPSWTDTLPPWLTTVPRLTGDLIWSGTKRIEGDSACRVKFDDEIWRGLKIKNPCGCRGYEKCAIQDLNLEPAD